MVGKVYVSLGQALIVDWSWEVLAGGLAGPGNSVMQKLPAEVCTVDVVHDSDPLFWTKKCIFPTAQSIGC